MAVRKAGETFRVNVSCHPDLPISTMGAVCQGSKGCALVAVPSRFCVRRPEFSMNRPFIDCCPVLSQARFDRRPCAAGDEPPHLRRLLPTPAPGQEGASSRERRPNKRDTGAWLSPSGSSARHSPSPFGSAYGLSGYARYSRDEATRCVGKRCAGPHGGGSRWRPRDAIASTIRPKDEPSLWDECRSLNLLELCRCTQDMT
jgi:hypothetical protein